jgi:hypothetical protein
MKLVFRDGEINYKQFTQLERSDKEKHMDFLLTLDSETLGTNDKYILLNFGPTKENKNFISTKDFDIL